MFEGNQNLGEILCALQTTANYVIINAITRHHESCPAKSFVHISDNVNAMTRVFVRLLDLQAVFQVSTQDIDPACLLIGYFVCLCQVQIALCLALSQGEGIACSFCSGDVPWMVPSGDHCNM